MRRGVAAAAFLIPALSLTVPSGYSWGALLLCLCAAGLLIAARHACRPSGVLLRFAMAVGVLGLVYTTDALTAHGWVWNGLDRPVKFGLALLAMAAVVHFPVPPHALKWGIWLGTLGAGVTAAHQVLVQGASRAMGYTNAIHFGDLGLLFGVWSWVWAYQETGRTRWLGWLAGAAGVYVSVASQSRGGWVMLPVFLALLVGLRNGLRHTAQPSVRPILFGGTALLALVLTFQWPMLKERVTVAVQEVQLFQNDQVGGESAATSVGQRFAHWHLALQMGWEKPVFGWGDDGYKREKRRRAESGEVHPFVAELGHAHNDWMEAWVKYGAVGALALGFVLGVPGVAYWRVLRRPSSETGLDPGDQGQRHAVALCGLVLVVGYVGFGQTQVMFAHNSGTMMYLFMNLLFLSACTAPGPAGISANPSDNKG